MLFRFALLASALAFLSACRSGQEDRAVNEESPKDQEAVATEASPTPVNGLLLEAKLVDPEEWIAELQWKNVGEKEIRFPVPALLWDDAEAGKTVPFHACDRRGVYLDRGEHGMPVAFDYLMRAGRIDYTQFRDDYVSRFDYQMGTTHFTVVTLKQGEIFSCKFSFPKDFLKPDAAPPDGKVPIDFSYRVGDAIRTNQVTYHSSGRAEREDDLAWRGGMASNVVFFSWPNSWFEPETITKDHPEVAETTDESLTAVQADHTHSKS